MSSRPLFRFVHASNLELDRFCAVEGELTHDQARMLIDAPFRAAERIFEVALREQAELILLAGGVFSGTRLSTWGASFLARQCERVARQGITVYWAEKSPEKTQAWPRFLPVPDNLIIANPIARKEVAITSASLVPISILCSCDPTQLRHRTGASFFEDEVLPPFTIGVQPHSDLLPVAQALPTGAVDVDYRAVQGDSRAGSLSAAQGMARTAGTPQARTRLEGTIGGCLLVEVGPGYSLGTRFIETNSLRYHTETIAVDDSINWESFRRDIHNRTEELLRQSTADALSLHWNVQGHGPVLERLIRPAAAAELQQELTVAFKGGRPTAWVTAFNPIPDAVTEARWLRDSTHYGTFVRTLDALPSGTETEVDLAELLESERARAEGLFAIEAAARRVSRPHFQTGIRTAARRHAAEVLSSLPR